MQYDLDDVGTRKALARQIKDDIDAYCQRTYDDGFRSHLGASIIGHECARYCWYTFRWCFASAFSGRMLRLFNRGHREEDRFIEWLDGIGCLVSATQADGKTQHRISDVEGHLGGSLDGGLALAQRYNIKQNIVLSEFKTSNDSAFKKMEKHGVLLAKPQHFAQMCTYGFKRDLDYAAYFCINKNNDDIHVEIVKLDKPYGEDLIRKGHDIITSRVPPRRISASETLNTCKMCDAREVCWHGAPVVKNCRSCVHAVPGPEKSWYCEGWKDTIPAATIPVGCDHHSSIAHQQ